MKLIIAYVRPEVLPAVKSGLFAAGIYAMSATNILGAGQQKGYTEVYRGVQTEVQLHKKLRLEIGVTEAEEDAAVAAIATAARTGAEGDGVIFVVALERGLRIRTGDALR